MDNRFGKEIDQEIKDIHKIYIIGVLVCTIYLSIRLLEPFWKWEKQWFVFLFVGSGCAAIYTGLKMLLNEYYRQSKKYTTVFKIHLYLCPMLFLVIFQLWIPLGLVAVRLLFLAHTLIKLYQPQKKYGNGDDLFVEPDGNETTSMTKSEREDSSDENLPILKTRKTMVKKHKNG
ncbi:MAG: hypothetical protein MJZ19_01485 [Paludibacteraceae bacterium]|nr:hypothetical protein [Paludibacteraceae bacterium]